LIQALTEQNVILSEMRLLFIWLYPYLGLFALILDNYILYSSLYPL